MAAKKKVEGSAVQLSAWQDAIVTVNQHESLCFRLVKEHMQR